MDGIHGVNAPCKWAMAVDKNCGNGIRIFPLEDFLDYQSSFLFVFAFDLDFCHLSGAGDLAIEIITLRCAERHDAAACLRKGCCPTAMGVNDAADVGKRSIEFKVRRRIGRRF